MTFTTCPDCDGTRLSKEARSSKIKGKNIADVCSIQISDLAGWVRGLDEPSVAPLLTGLQHLLDSFAEIGLGYLSLDRPWGTLSGGEAQRTKMIRHLGSSLTDVTYVFDEPTIGLHPHDVERMNDLLLRLRDKGNTLLVVEHEPETIATADHVVDLGPGAGAAGGTVCFEGTVEGLRASGTITGRHLDDRAGLKEAVRTPTGTLEIRGADTNNLHDVDVDIPLGVLVVVTGVAGSGKSSLVHGSIPPARWCGVDRPGRDPRLATEQPGDVHRTARPNPQGVREGQRSEAGAVQRQLRGRLPELQRRRGHLHRPGDDGRRRHHLRECEGKRYQAPVLEYRLGGGCDIFGAGEAVLADVGDRGQPLSSSAPARRAGRPRQTILDRLADVGLGDLEQLLGQPLTTLSGGERQRRRPDQAGHPSPWRAHPTLRRHLTVYVLDEPLVTGCPGLHWTPTSSSCSACSTGSWTRASRSSSSSITRRSWRTPTGSSTSAPAPATTAGRMRLRGS